MLKGLFAQGLIEPAIYTQEDNALATEADRVKAENSSLAYQTRVDRTHLEEAKKLFVFTEHTEMMTAFDGDAFEEWVERILVKSRENWNFT